MKLAVKNVKGFELFLKSIIKIIPSMDEGCKFTVTNKETKVNILNGSRSVRAFFTTDALTTVSDKKIEFCFKNIATLIKSISLISNIEDEDEVELDFTGTFLKYENSVKFKLKTCKDDDVRMYMTEERKTKLDPVFSFETSPLQIKRVLDNVNICGNTDAKLYLSKNENDEVLAEVDDKTSEYSNSVGIPISDEIDGDINEVICIFLDNFALFNIVPSDEISVTYNKQKVLVVESEMDYDDITIKMDMITSTAKG